MRASKVTCYLLDELIMKGHEMEHTLNTLSLLIEGGYIFRCEPTRYIVERICREHEVDGVAEIFVRSVHNPAFGVDCNEMPFATLVEAIDGALLDREMAIRDGE